MSRRTKLYITALFLVLLAIPATYIAITWRPHDALRFRVEHIAPPSAENAGADRKLRVSIENTTAAPVHFYGAVMMRESPPAVLPTDHPGKVMIARDLMAGIVAPQLLERGTPFDADYPFLVPAFLVFDARVGEPLVIPAHHTVHVAAVLPAKHVDSTPPRDILVHYHWETQTRVTARNVAKWFRHHSPSWAEQVIPQLSHQQDTAPLHGIGK